MLNALPSLSGPVRDGHRTNHQTAFFATLGQELAQDPQAAFATLRAMSRDLQAKAELRRLLHDGLCDLLADLPADEQANIRAMLMTLMNAALQADDVGRTRAMLAVGGPS